MKLFGLVKPPLVEGPGIVFGIPVPHNFPLAYKLADGSAILPVTTTVITTWIIMAFLVLLFRWGTKDLSLENPSKKQAFFETLYHFYDSVVGQILGKWKDKYLVYISSLLTFLFISNTITFFPVPWLSRTDVGWSLHYLFRAPTADLNTTVGLALITTMAFLSAAFATSGPVGYFKGLLEPFPLMLPLNIVGEGAKPVNISMRLFGNMFAGSVILGLLYKAAPAVVPAPLHLYFDLFSGAIQSYVFTMLTMVYIQGALGDAQPE
ncbi:F-type H+-transporting ATPase subunit a [Hypnocyclicus thermotrophus]|uniref:ATP synthase subunit a n=1 Tax=Hypnocyclicus thermotrophus TaxID=1627895 RepID=A0AA46DZ18_9FUSO|nr:F0F1 ATP synthase subunit A [Hypnocyclicus thermotrophus]TDT70540.1 F-type H+-transporting ATPase subunit a [Hypnocyclicus thermotrophus]